MLSSAILVIQNKVFVGNVYSFLWAYSSQLNNPIISHRIVGNTTNRGDRGQYEAVVDASKQYGDQL
jgi:hypothetical protein